MKLATVTIVFLFCFLGTSTQAEPNVHPHAKILGALVYTDISISSDGEEASSIINAIREELGVLLQVYWETKTVDGLRRDAPIFLTLENMPALVVLERVIEQMSDVEETTWQIRDGVLEVGLKSRFARRNSQQLIAYPIDDLLFTIRDYDNAPKMGTSGGGSGGSGGSGGGGGGGGIGGAGGGRGGGGSGGGSGGGAGGSSGGGGVGFGAPSEDPEAPTKQEQIDKIIDLITTFIEPEQWKRQGGECTIKDFKETLLISAPDFMHRQIGGYPFDPVRPSTIRLRRVSYSNGKTNVRVDPRPIK